MNTMNMNIFILLSIIVLVSCHLGYHEITSNISGNDSTSLTILNATYLKYKAFTLDCSSNVQIIVQSINSKIISDSVSSLTCSGLHEVGIIRMYEEDVEVIIRNCGSTNITAYFWYSNIGTLPNESNTSQPFIYLIILIIYLFV